MTAWLLDTGPLVAFFDRSDADHEWAKAQWALAPVPMLTCEAVLAEAEHARLPSEKILALFERNVITVPFSLEAHACPVAHLLEKYRDQGMQLADACLVRMSELKRACQVFTLDKHAFRIYRRFERHMIPLLTPD